MSAQPAPRLFSTVFGLLMVASSAAPADGPALLAAAVAGLGVLVAVAVRPVATFAVLAVVAALALSQPPPLFAALSGLSAAAYLVIRHAIGAPGVVTTTRPTVLCAIGFTAAGLAALAVPAQMLWLPLLAPLCAAGMYLLSIRPFVENRRWYGPGYRAM